MLTKTYTVFTITVVFIFAFTLLTPTTHAQTPDCNFTRDLSVGSRGSDVNCLQQYLQAQGFFPGNTSTTQYFGPATQTAVRNWQLAEGVAPAEGYFGPVSISTYQQVNGQATQSVSNTQSNTVNTQLDSVRSELQQQIRSLMQQVIALLTELINRKQDQLQGQTEDEQEETDEDDQQQNEEESDDEDEDDDSGGGGGGGSSSDNSDNDNDSEDDNQNEDTEAPTISSISESVDTDSATISWTTNEDSDSEVNYGTTDSYGDTESDSSDVTSHSLDLTGLSDDTTYHYQISSTDDDGNTQTTGDRTFTTDEEEQQQQSGTDSRSGDEAALEALYSSANGSNWNNNTGWSSSGMDLSDSIYGVETDTIGGERRVTEINLKNNNLTGDIDISELANLQEMTLFDVMLNSLNSPFPDAITDVASLEYLYLSGSDQTSPLDEHYPHEEAETGGQVIHVGKGPGSEENVFSGAIPSSIDNLENLRWFFLGWTDTWDGRDIVESNGITSIPDSIWNIDSLEGLFLYENWNIADSGNTLTWPDSIANMSNLSHIALGGGSGTDWDEYDQGYMEGDFPDDTDQLTNVHQWSIHRHAGLTNLPDLSGTTELRSFHVNNSGWQDQPFPEWLVDGRNSQLDSVNLGSGVGDTFHSGPLVTVNNGFTGQLPEFGNLSGLDSFTIRFSKLEGSIPESYWHTNPDGIRKMTLGHNRFTSIGTTDLTHLEDTNHLRWSWSFVSEPWPNLNWSDPPPLDYVWFEGNKYTFADMLWVPDEYNPNNKTIFDLYNDVGITQSFRYSPQRPFGDSASYSPSEGSNITLDDFNSDVTHEDNQYQWQKDGSDISGATSRELTINNAQTSDSGTYTLEVTNPGVPSLTLESEEIEISVGGVQGVQTTSLQAQLDAVKQKVLELLEMMSSRD